LHGLLARGDFYEALGVTADASAKVLLLAIMSRRREVPDLDAAWNALHDVLLRRPAEYALARAERDAALHLAGARDPSRTMARYDAETVWRRLWPSLISDGLAPARARALRTEMDQWWQAERALLMAWNALLADYGPAMLRLVRVRSLDALIIDARTPAALRRQAEQLSAEAARCAGALSSIMVTPHDVESGRAQVASVRPGGCIQCGWTGHISGGQQFVTTVCGQTYQGPPGRVLCPMCCVVINYSLSKQARAGWVVQGQDPTGALRYARLDAIVSPPPAPAARPAKQAAPTRPAQKRSESPTAARPAPAPARQPAAGRSAGPPRRESQASARVPLRAAIAQHQSALLLACLAALVVGALGYNSIGPSLTEHLVWVFFVLACLFAVAALIIAGKSA
jgi:hypothetical protein